MATLNLIAPWVEHYRKINAFFKRDPEVNVIYDDKDRTIKLYVANANKAAALENLLIDELTFGAVTLSIEVIPPNESDKVTIPRNIFSVAFEENPIITDIITVSGVMTNSITYVVFAKEVVQYFNDDLSDYAGNRSTLYEILAKEIFRKMDGIYYCTNVSIYN